MRIRSVTMFHTGVLRLPNRSICPQAPAGIGTHPLSCALIEHPQHGPILFDTGLGSEAASLFRSPLPAFPIVQWLARALLSLHFNPDSDSLLTTLRALGVDPQSIKHVIMSHLHVDHTGGMRDLPGALFYVSRAEWRRRPLRDSVGTLLKGWHPADYQGAAVHLVDYDQPLSGYAPFDVGYDMFGDGSCILLSTPGHTPGHQSLLLKLASGREVLLLGDAVYMNECVHGPYEITRIARSFRSEDSTAWNTVQRLHALWCHHPDLTLIACHDHSLGQQLQHGPVVIV